nr:tyrosine-type recombinase/integrase [Microbispora cellulosiformans]
MRAACRRDRPESRSPPAGRARGPAGYTPCVLRAFPLGSAGRDGFPGCAVLPPSFDPLTVPLEDSSGNNPSSLPIPSPGGSSSLVARLLSRIVKPAVSSRVFPAVPPPPPTAPRRRRLDGVGKPVTSKKAGLNEKEWTPREMRHSFVSLLSASGVPIENISRLVGHSNTRVTETVYRKQLRPVLLEGAEAMDGLFSEGRSPKQ